LSEEQKRETELITVSVDDRAMLQKMLDQISKDGLRVDYTFLSDPGHKVIDRYGILNPTDRRGIPHPTMFVIDKRGVVRWKFMETNYKIRPTNEMILGALAQRHEK
jgi:alkyl hydroperoxide reductase subunit AhpC